MITNTTVLFTALCILAAGIAASCIIFTINYSKYLKNKLRISEFNITSHLEIDSKLSEKLDEFISSSLNEYIILNLPPVDENNYISPEKETEIRNGLSNYISTRISSVFMQQLSTYYNAEAMNDILATKIYIIVTNFVIIRNQTYQVNSSFRPNLPDYTDMNNSGRVTNIFDPSINF